MWRPATLVWLLFVVACGSDTAPGGDDTPPPPPGGPRFYEDVAPILARQCVGCHQPGGIAPFSLITYADASDVAELIPNQVTTRSMPPWGADNSGGCNTFQDARWLADDEIATIVAWASGDKLEGDPAAAPPLPEKPPGLSRVDATAAMTESYIADQTLSDDYRCFIVDPGVATDQFLTGFEVRPGEPAVVHHILLFQLADAAAETAAANLDAQSPGPGYTCFGGAGANANLLGVWAPGMRVATYPANTGLKVLGGRKMLIQIHYHNHGTPLPDRTAVDLRLEPSVANPSLLFLFPATNLSLPPGLPSVATTNTLTLPGILGQYNVWGVYPHMHTLGRTLRLENTHAGQTQCLIDVPRWDFNWQQGYFYDGPPKIAGGGDTLRITCTHDTTSRTTTTTWGEGTNDEMCLAFAYVSPY
jgi:copper type II ascorbate-dependent monooxygenase-like protein